jgi:dUTP pyrophosphatase
MTLMTNQEKAVKFAAPLELRWTKLHPDAREPHRAYDQSVGLDVFALIKREDGSPHHAIVGPQSTRAIRTGLAMHPPLGHALLVCSRSGMAKDASVFVTNAPGVVDPDFRGELLVLVYNGGHQSYFVRDGDRIAQLLVVPVPTVTLTQVNELSPSDRGEKGWGSSGR